MLVNSSQCIGATHYWGQLQKVFSEDPESDVTQIEMKFLHRKETCTEPETLDLDFAKCS